MSDLKMWMHDFWLWNKESIYLSAVVGVIGGIAFATSHEATKWLWYAIKDKIGK